MFDISTQKSLPLYWDLETKSTNNGQIDYIFNTILFDRKNNYEANEYRIKIRVLNHEKVLKKKDPKEFISQFARKLMTINHTTVTDQLRDKIIEFHFDNTKYSFKIIGNVSNEVGNVSNKIYGNIEFNNQP